MPRHAVLLAVLCALAACAAPQREQHRFKYRPSRAEPCQFELFELHEQPERPYEVLGVLPYTAGNGASRKERKAGLHQVACRAGADAVVLHEIAGFEIGGRLHRRWEARFISYDLRPSPAPVPERPAPDLILTPPEPAKSLTPGLDALLGLEDRPDGGS